MAELIKLNLEPAGLERKRDGGQKQFTTRMNLLKQKYKGILTKETREYVAYTLFCPFIVVRAYATKFTIHTNGDLDHYECKDMLYTELRWETHDLEFVVQLLNLIENDS